MEYLFPTQFLKDSTQDTKYLDLYHGEAVEISEENIALSTLSTEKESENIETEAGLESVPDIKSDYGRKGKRKFGY